MSPHNKRWSLIRSSLSSTLYRYYSSSRSPKESTGDAFCYSLEMATVISWLTYRCKPCYWSHYCHFTSLQRFPLYSPVTFSFLRQAGQMMILWRLKMFQALKRVCLRLNTDLVPQPPAASCRRNWAGVPCLSWHVGFCSLCPPCVIGVLLLQCVCIKAAQWVVRPLQSIDQDWSRSSIPRPSTYLDMSWKGFFMWASCKVVP